MCIFIYILSVLYIYIYTGVELPTSPYTSKTYGGLGVRPQLKIALVAMLTFC